MAFETILLPGLVLGLTLTAVARLVYHVLPEKSRPTGSPPLGTMVSCLILIFAFVVGLTISQETSQLSGASDAASSEANSIGELYWYAHALSQPEHDKLQGELRHYANVVANEEWPMLGNHKTDPAASAAIRAIRFDILSFQPQTPTEKSVYLPMLNQVSSLFDARRVRNNIASHGGVPPILIEGIVLLTAITVLLVPATGKLHTPGHLAIYAVFATFMISTLFFVVDLNNPFKGDLAQKPTAFSILFTGTFKNVS